MVQVKIPRDNYNFETLSVEPSQARFESIYSPLALFREFIRALPYVANTYHITPFPDLR